MKIEFCNKCGKPKNYTGRDKHIVSCCKCDEKKKTIGGNKMKRLFLVLALVLLVGCGVSFDTSGTDLINKFYSATGSGAITTWTDEFDRVVTKNQGNPGVIGGSYKVVKSVGGSGSIALASVASGATCVGALPLETIVIVANTPALIFTNFQPATIAELDRIAKLPVSGGFKFCLTYIQADTTNPINTEVQFVLTVTD